MTTIHIPPNNTDMKFLTIATALTWLLHYAAELAKYTPFLHALSLALSITVSLVTLFSFLFKAVFWVVKVLKK